MRSAKLGLVLLSVISFAIAGSCSSNSNVADEKTTGPSTTISTTPDMRDLRYCEVLLVSLANSQPVATVYNSYPLNDCPESSWAALDPKQIATDFGANIAVLNGPRYWLMNHVEKIGAQTTEKSNFGGIEMYQQATVPIGSLSEQTRPYSPYPVSRSTIFRFDAGVEIFRLTSPDGSVFVMQSFSQQKDPTLTLASLPTLATRLELPIGWSYGSETLGEELSIETVNEPAQVLQDNLGNSYSKIPTTPKG